MHALNDKDWRLPGNIKRRKIKVRWRSKKMNILIAGASGLVGSQFIKQATQHSSIEKLVAISRRPLDFSHPKLQVILTDLSKMKELNLAELVPGLNFGAGISCLGTTIKKARTREAFYFVYHDLVLDFADLAQRHGAHRFAVVSAQGANPHSPIFYSRVKGKTENDLQRVAFESLSILRPSLLIGEREEKRRGEALAIRLEPLYSPLLLGPLKKFQPVKAESVARAALVALLEQKSSLRVIENDEIHALGDT
jgi:uncharacterized protein YbjT (DUF2867 family)